MPSPTIRLRVTERLAALIERVWKAAPELRDDFPATVLNALALYSEYREGRPSMFGAVKQQPQDEPTEPTGEINPLPSQPQTEQKIDNPDDDWA